MRTRAAVALEAGKPLDVLFLCSLTVAGNRLVGNARHPGIVRDFRRTFDRLGREKADVVLPFHPGALRELGRVDAGALPRAVAEARAAFEAELVKQESAVSPGSRRGPPVR